MAPERDPFVRDQVSRLMAMLPQPAIAKSTTRRFTVQQEDVTEIADDNVGQQRFRHPQDALVDQVGIVDPAPASRERRRLRRTQQ